MRRRHPNVLLIAAALALPCLLVGCGPQKKLKIVTPSEGEVLDGPAPDGKVRFKVVLESAGLVLDVKGPKTLDDGHSVLIIDGEPVKAGQIVPADDTHLHLEKSQHVTTISVATGARRLTAQYVDGKGVSAGPELADSVLVTVQALPQENVVESSDPVTPTAAPPQAATPAQAPAAAAEPAPAAAAEPAPAAPAPVAPGAAAPPAE